MEYQENYLIISTDEHILQDENYAQYVAHLVCNKGQLNFSYQEKPFICQAGQGLITRPGILMEVTGTPDVEVRIVLTHIDFHYMSTPQSNYGVQGTLSLFINPIIELTPQEHLLLNQDMDQISYRLQHTTHFRHDVLQCATQMLFLDYFQPHIRVVKDQHINSQQASTMTRFIQLLNNGSYKEHRDVAWYASELCITPKYLSEISQTCSGTNASYWIHRYTTTEIHRRLNNRNIPLNQICEEFGFCSPSHFSRYVVQHLGKKPVDFRS